MSQFPHSIFDGQFTFYDDEDLACLGGFRRERDWFRETFGDLLTKPTPAPVPTAPPQRRQRKPSIASMVKQAERSGHRVTSAVIDGDKVVLTFSEPDEPQAASDLDQWLAKRAKDAHST